MNMNNDNRLCVRYNGHETVWDWDEYSFTQTHTHIDTDAVLSLSLPYHHHSRIFLYEEEITSK